MKQKHMEKLAFQADIQELMNLIIHAFYSNRDVFVREIVSNASDALDKQRFFDLKNNMLDGTYHILLTSVADEKKLIVEDTGVGMSRADLIENLSTIARSGTKQFVEALKDAEKTAQIGQFGVGFYSVFLVADHVEVFSQKEGEPVFKWSSDAQTFYTLEEIVDGSVVFEHGHGTRLVLTLKDDAKEYLDEATLRRIITTHSSFITYPIKLWVSKEVPVDDANTQTTSEDIEDVEQKEKEDGQVEDVEQDGQVEDVDEDDVANDEDTQTATPKEKKTRTVQEWETINEDKPIWYMSPKDVPPTDYTALYKTISKDFDEPLFYRHFQTEGAFEFRGVLFVPKRPPYDILGDGQKEKRKIRLYVKKVLVLNELDKEMLPDWMNFVVGIIDSADLPLNVSREMLQQTTVLKAMKSQLKKQILTMLCDLLSDKDKYDSFYNGFQKHIKLGIHEGDETLIKFLRVHQTGSSDVITFDEYVSSMKDDQTNIYYATGVDAEKGVFTKAYAGKGYNVLLFKDAIDEFMLQRVTKYKEHDLVNIQKEHQAPWQTETSSQQDEFCKWLNDKLGDADIEKVRVSQTLVAKEDAPCCVVSSKHGWTGNMERIMMSQPLNDAKSMFWMKGKKIFEVNVQHPIMQRMYSSFEQKQENETDTNDLKLLYQTALVAAGFPLQEPSLLLESVASRLETVAPTQCVNV